MCCYSLRWIVGWRLHCLPSLEPREQTTNVNEGVVFQFENSEDSEVWEKVPTKDWFGRSYFRISGGYPNHSLTTGVGLSSPEAVLTQQFNEVLSYLEVSTVELRVQEYMDIAIIKIVDALVQYFWLVVTWSLVRLRMFFHVFPYTSSFEFEIRKKHPSWNFLLWTCGPGVETWTSEGHAWKEHYGGVMDILMGDDVMGAKAFSFRICMTRPWHQ